MSWSYDSTDLDNDTESGRLNIVRLLVGDTNTLDQQVQDEEITFALSVEADNTYKAASWIAKTLSAKYSRFVDIDLDGQLSESYSQLKDHYTSLATKLQSQATSNSVTLGASAGGVLCGDVYLTELDPTRVQPKFKVGQYDYETDE